MDSKTKRKNKKGTDAVSPVIGVILMVAITVILAAVIGTFVLGLGENVDETASAGVSVDQVDGESFQATLVDVGSLDSAGIVGPSGARSALGSTDNLIAAGTSIRVASDGNWDSLPDAGTAFTSSAARTPASLGGNSNESGLVISTVNYTQLADRGETGAIGAVADGVDLSSVAGTFTADQLPGVDNVGRYQGALQAANSNECYISHGANVVSGVQVGQAAIGCTGLAIPVQAAVSGNGINVVDPADASGGLDPGSPIRYEAGAEYSLVGEVDGSENVVQTFETDEG